VILDARGIVDLDVPLPERPYTLHQLLGHRAGVPDYGYLDDYRRAVADGETAWSRADLSARMARERPLFAPGAGWAYSNFGFMLVRERLERALDRGFEEIVRELVLLPLNLPGIALSETRADFARLHWPQAAVYDPKWVYHGCLTGTAEDAARLLHGLASGAILPPGAWDDMTRVSPLFDAPLPGRPWDAGGYGLGVMGGTVPGLGRAVGHSGGGPFSVAAIYHFPDGAEPVTVACFAEAGDEGVAEHAAVRLAAEA